MSGIVKGLFGGKSRAEKQLERVRPVSFTSPGLTGRARGDRVDVSRSAGLTGALQGLVRGLGERSQAFRGLRSRVAPGFGDLTRARVDAIRRAGSRTIGNLRGQLGQRRVLGSSFAQREIASTEALFAQEEERARAEGTVGEIALTGQLIEREFAGAIEAAQSLINQFNFEASLGANLATASQNLQQANATAQAQAAASSEGGAAEFLGTVVGFGLLASDRRLKRNIRRKGQKGGYPWYSFTYLWGEKSEGVMADEIPQRFVRWIRGFRFVDYGGLYGSI